MRRCLRSPVAPHRAPWIHQPSTATMTHLRG
ncbi:hypothetical protein HNR30_001808 [Nonomuraea soli]|uniref:Uncharacterized protein n=1 Tax=Nonomuraea soli TaxID=1032476 RepID=A0A7W0HP77_9ACTN|nr:hypothetical protein [Nonomuraea soli]